MKIKVLLIFQMMAILLCVSISAEESLMELPSEFFTDYLYDLPEDSLTIPELGNIHIDKRPTQKLRETLISYVEKYPENIHVLLNSAYLMDIKLGSEEEAIDIYKKALEVSPDSYFARKQLGFLLHSVLKFDEAKVYLMSCLKHEPDSDELCYYLGSSYLETGDLSNAESAFLRIIEGPEYGEYNEYREYAKKQLRFIYLHNNLFSKIEKYQEELFPDISRFSILHNKKLDLARFYLYKGKKQRALVFLDSLYSSEIKDYQVLLKLSYYYAKLEMFDKLVLCHEKALKTFPCRDEAYINFSLYYYNRLRDIDSAIIVLQRYRSQDCSTSLKLDRLYYKLVHKRNED